MNIQELKTLRRTLISKAMTALNVRHEALTRLNDVYFCNIELSNNMRSCAGRANYTRNTIILNNRLLADNPHHLETTFAHELAHLISYALYGQSGKGHGRNWKQVMRALGYSPDRCHTLDVSALKRRHAVKGMAKCGCTTHKLKARRYNKILNGSRYRCLVCNIHLEII